MSRISRACLTLLAVTVGSLFAAALSADDSEQGIEFRVAQVSAGSGGVYTYTADEWGLLRVQLTNHRDRAVELLCVTYFDSEPTLQYGRRIWLPAQSRIMTWHPIHLPASSGGGEGDRAAFHTLVSEVGATDDYVRDEIGKVQYASDLQIVTRRPITAVIGAQGHDYMDPGDTPTPVDIITTARIDLSTFSPRDIAGFGDRMLPPSELGLASLQQIVVADDRMLGDAAALSALRQWLYGGGRLWIMLDMVDPDLLSALLGDESGCHVVDTVSLNELHFSSPHEHGVSDYVSEYEQPVKLMRVMVDDEEVPLLVNGWPAAYWKEFGRGRLLVTTLGSSAWVMRKSADEMNRDRGEYAAWPFASTPALRQLMGPYFSQMPEASTVPEIFEPKVREYIGYSIPSRWLVSGLLAISIVLLAGAGIWLLRSGRLERLTWVIPAVTLVAAGALVLIGRQGRQAVPPSTALIQMVRPIPGTGEVRVTGNAGLYATDSANAVLGGENGGWILPELTGTEGTIRRMIWSDLDRWEWEGLPQFPGLRTAEFQTSLRTQVDVSARAEFGPEGLTGRLTMPEGLDPRDAILVTEFGRIGVELDEGGDFTADSNEVLGTDEYLPVGLLSDDQSRRSRILADLLQETEIGQVKRPTLFLWTNPWEAGFQFDDESQRSGSALVAVPVELRRPAAGTEVSLPAPLLPYRESSGPDGYRPSGLFDNRDLVWLAKPSPATAWLRFQVPQVLLPIEIASARIVARVTGPVGKLELSVARDGEIVPLQTWIDPVGTLTLELNGSELPAPDDEGGVLIRVVGGDADRPELYEPNPESGKLNYWRIESLTMEVDATVQERESSDATE